jgi:hypothetical protein
LAARQPSNSDCDDNGDSVAHAPIVRGGSRPCYTIVVAKDRARPFSRKHRKYWLTVTGGMIVIGLINVAIGVWAYEEGPTTTERIIPNVPGSTKEPADTIPLGQLPPEVMRGFNHAIPRQAPRYARQVDTDIYEITYMVGTATKTARIKRDGTVIP